MSTVRFLIVMMLVLGFSISVIAAENGQQADSPVVVYPEHTMKVILSSTDVNRFVCPGPIKDVMFSQDKGIKVKISGENAFIKFQALKKGQEIRYSKTPSEFYVVCDGDVYSLIGLPQQIPAQTIRLSTGLKKKISKNLALFSGLPLEKKILKLIKQAYTDDLPESYTVWRLHRPIDLFQQVNLMETRNILIEGEGLGVREYVVSLKPGRGQWHLSEKDFLKSALTSSPLAIAIEEPLLKPGEKSRVFIVERRHVEEMKNPLVKVQQTLQSGTLPKKYRSQKVFDHIEEAP